MKLINKAMRNRAGQDALANACPRRPRQHLTDSPGQCGLAPENLATLAHFSAS